MDPLDLRSRPDPAAPGGAPSGAGAMASATRPMDPPFSPRERLTDGIAACRRSTFEMECAGAQMVVALRVLSLHIDRMNDHVQALAAACKRREGSPIARQRARPPSRHAWALTPWIRLGLQAVRHRPGRE